MAGKLFYGDESVHGHDPRLAKAFEEGKVAIDSASCPHPPETPAYKAWNAGFNFAHPQVQQVSRQKKKAKSLHDLLSEFR